MSSQVAVRMTMLLWVRPGRLASAWCGGTPNRRCVRGQGGLRVGGAVTLAELVDLLGGADGRGSDVQSNIAAHMSRIAGADETVYTPYQCGTSGSLKPQSKVVLDVCCIHPPPLMCRALLVRPAPLPARSPPPPPEIP